MSTVTKNINLEELKCKCGCGLSTMSRGTLVIVQMVRDKFNSPVNIHSACRCKKHNEAVGGEDRSQHIPDSYGLCHAIDFDVQGVSCDKVYSYLNELFQSSVGLGLYKTFVHVDDRLIKARWINK